MKVMKLLFVVLYFMISSLFASTLTFTPEEKDWLEKNQVIKIGESPNFEPLLIETQNNKLIGIIPDFYNYIGKQLGVKFEYIADSWPNILQQLKSLEIDAVGIMSKNAAIKNDFIHVSLPFNLLTVIYAKNEHKFKINDDKDIKNLRIAYFKNIIYIADYLKKQKHVTLVEKDTPLEAYRAVLNDEADVMIGLNTDNYILTKNTIFNIKPIYTFKNLKTDTVIGVNQNNKIFAKILEKILNNINSNDLAKILSKWTWIPKELTHSNLSEIELEYLSKKKIIKMCVLPNWLPFEQIDETGQHKGIGADLMQIVSKYINTPIVLVPTKEWKTSLQNIGERKCDILPVAMDLPSRRTTMNFTKPYVAEPFVVATNQSEFFIKDSQSLANKKIGIVKSYAFIEVLKRRNPTIQIIEVKNAYDGMKRVQSGELFGYVDIMPAVGYTIQKYAMFDLKIAGKLEFDIKLSVATRNDEPILNNIMQKALNDISDDQIRTIVGKWIAIKVEQSFDYTRLFYVVGTFLIIIILILYKNRSMKDINKKLSLANKEIKEQQKITESLNQYQESLLSLFDKGDAVLFKWKYEDDWSIEYVSKSIEKLLGQNKKEFIDNKVSYSSFIHKDDLEEVTNKIKSSLAEGVDYFNHEPYRIITKDGNEKWILDYMVTLKDSNGKTSHLLGYITDITEHIKHQDIILQQSKMASLGEMIGNISHQWRQPLSLISSVATGSKLKKEFNLLPDNEFNRNMDIINENAQYLSRTIDDFKNFVKGERELSVFNLFENIQSFLNVVNPTKINNNIEVIEDCDKDILIEGYPNELIQCLINVFNNSKDVLIKVPDDERYFFITLKKTDNNACILLKDSGGGIDENIIGTIFEPYTTTKHKSKGTGLGLNITYNFIVTGMHGNIEVKNSNFRYKDKNYVGAEFKITLPLSK